MDDLYLENLEEFINDEEKIVTYKWLSLTLKVPCNIAKQMLFRYVSDKRESKEGCKLHVTYLVSGLTYCSELNQDIHKICVVRNENLSSLKEKFKRIFSIHIYSVQKSQLRDLNLLYAADYDIVKENVHEISSYSGIVCPSIQVRSSEEINVLEKQLAYKSSSPTKPNLKTNNKTATETKPEPDNENKENKLSHGNLQAPNTEPKRNAIQSSIKKNVPTPKGQQGGIASMFARQSKKMDGVNAQEKVVSNTGKSAATKEKKISGKGCLSNFLTKSVTQNEKISVKEELEVDKNTKNLLSEKIVKSEIPICNQPEKSPKKTEIKKEGTSSLTKKEEKILPKVNNKKSVKSKNSLRSKGGKGKRKSDEEDPLSSVKRRRIVTFGSSSESSSDEKDDLDEEPLPIALSALESDDDLFPLTPQNDKVVASELPKGKKRKLVDKTFMDENGYFVTKKEYENVTDSSDDENPLNKSNVKTKSDTVIKVDPKKEAKPLPVIKKSPVKTKQSSIMSFFKRK